jgi:NAD(P)-dependent dehydrogenase (short-subunit alcohol dehydrogenase family)
MKETWLVTGSSVGLGRSIVEAALAEGHRAAIRLAIATILSPDLHLDETGGRS